MTYKPKVALIGVKGLPAFGGAARFSESIIKYLSSEYDFTVYEIDSYKKVTYISNLYKSVLFRGSSIKRLNTLLYYIKSCFHALFLGDYDLIHTQHLYSGFIIPLLRIRFKVITTIHGIIPDDDNKWNTLDKKIFRFFEKISLNYSNISVSVSQPQITYLQALTKKKILYIPNGVDIDGTLLNKGNKISKDCLVFSAARIIKLKGCHTFLKALNEIHSKQKIKIIGNLDQVEEYKYEIIELAKDLNVSFLGLITEKDKLFTELLSAKVFVFPSSKEGLSNMLLETASLNIPIICSDIEENKAIFDENEVLFFKTEDFKDLGKKIIYAQQNISDMKIRACKAFTKLERKYLWKNISMQYLDLYKSLI